MTRAALLLLAACATAPPTGGGSGPSEAASTAGSPTVTPSAGGPGAIRVSRMPTADDLTGEYAAVKAPAASGRVRIELSCFHSPERFVITQHSGRVDLQRVFPSFVSGPVPPPPPTEQAAGALGKTLVIEGERNDSYPEHKTTHVRYELRFDAASSHLVGKRNGEPIELAPFEWIGPAHDCGPPPP